MTTIVEFIEARLQDDYAMATGGWIEGYDRGDEWVVYKIPGHGSELAAGIFVFAAEAPPYSHVERIKDGETGHIEQHDPARVLRQVDRLRALTNSAAAALADNHAPETGILADEILRNVAAIWANHPDYQQEWKPSRGDELPGTG